MIEVCELTKRYGAAVAVDGLSLTVHPGPVTGFLGPNGAGKSTTMRVILVLDAPTAGRATIGRQPYARLRRPLHQVGALLDAGAAHGGRTARNHLARFLSELTQWLRDARAADLGPGDIEVISHTAIPKCFSEGVA